MNINDMKYYLIDLSGGNDLYIIYVRNYKVKVVLAIVLLFSLGSTLLFSHFILKNNLAFRVTINNHISFAHPLTLEVNNIFVNENLNPETVKVNYTFGKSAAQNFVNFDSLRGSFSFKYPASFSLSEKSFFGSEILYHIDVQNEALESHGFIQVWNLPHKLKDFLAESEILSHQAYNNFVSREITVNGIHGCFWEYSVVGHEKRNYKGLEAFLQKDETMYRISYFVSENKWNKSQSEIFWKMVRSFRIYQQP